MRPASSKTLFQVSELPTLQAFAQVARSAVDRVQSELQVSTRQVHMGKEPLEVSPTNPEFLEQIRGDLMRYGKVILTLVWGEGPDDWETLALFAGISEITKNPVIVAMWVGQDAHEMIAQKARPTLH